MSGTRDSILPSIEWLSEHSPIPAAVSDWLMELGSMTRRFERHCGHVHIEPQRECFVTRSQLAPAEAKHLPHSERYWLREIVLLGDGQPWLQGRTLIPQETLTGPDQALVDLGTLPLGRYLFSSNSLTRDYINIGRWNTLWARRSRLRLAGKPLLLTELFLPASPLYKVKKGTPA